LWAISQADINVFARIYPPVNTDFNFTKNYIKQQKPFAPSSFFHHLYVFFAALSYHRRLAAILKTASKMNPSLSFPAII
jgi:hypothetical protein